MFVFQISSSTVHVHHASQTFLILEKTAMLPLSKLPLTDCVFKNDSLGHTFNSKIKKIDVITSDHGQYHITASITSYANIHCYHIHFFMSSTSLFIWTCVFQTQSQIPKSLISTIYSPQLSGSLLAGDKPLVPTHPDN